MMTMLTDNHEVTSLKTYLNGITFLSCAFFGGTTK